MLFNECLPCSGCWDPQEGCVLPDGALLPVTFRGGINFISSSWGKREVVNLKSITLHSTNEVFQGQSDGEFIQISQLIISWSHPVPLSGSVFHFNSLAPLIYMELLYVSFLQIHLSFFFFFFFYIFLYNSLWCKNQGRAFILVWNIAKMIVPKGTIIMELNPCFKMAYINFLHLGG